jgi:hypothetical protein
LLRDDETERTPQDLTPGTELARAVYAHQKPLIRAGTVLDAEDIQVLRNWDVESVVVKTVD